MGAPGARARAQRNDSHLNWHIASQQVTQLGHRKLGAIGLHVDETRQQEGCASVCCERVVCCATAARVLGWRARASISRAWKGSNRAGVSPARGAQRDARDATMVSIGGPWWEFADAGGKAYFYNEDTKVRASLPCARVDAAKFDLLLAVALVAMRARAARRAAQAAARARFSPRRLRLCGAL